MKDQSSRFELEVGQSYAVLPPPLEERRAGVIYLSGHATLRAVLSDGKVRLQQFNEGEVFEVALDRLRRY